MSKNFTTLIAAACLLFSFTPQASASPDGGASNSNSSSSNSSSSSADIPKKSVGAVLGSVIGTPICMVRRMLINDWEGARGITCDSNNLFLIVPACALFLPCAAIGGVMEGPGYAINNSFRAEPFSKDQFSLGEMQK